ncbi:general stress protein [Mastigocladopsis repens]|uniref:general stress protein n=1 Tax=Mastigocladopsis repens TaxID=221287 RepID=UPI0002DEF8F1|nr:general stress protein [Mastigocladopsis repens]
MVIGVHKRAVGVFSHRRDAEDALYELRNSGFPIDRVSVIKRDADRNDDIAGAEVRENVGNKSDEGATVGAVSGGVLGGLTGLLVGLGTLAIPGIGPIMLAGATATALATTLAGAGIGAAAGSLLGALIGLGIPEERARVYNERVERGDYLVIIDGTDAEIATAEEILRRRGIEEFGVFNRPNVTTGTAEYVPATAATTGVPNTGFGKTKHAVGYFSHLRDAEAAIHDLRDAGFPLSQISLFHREPVRREPFAGVTVSDRFDAMRLGFPDARARFYNDRIHQGDYVVIVSGTDDDIHRAATILNRHGIQQWEIYDPTVISSTQPVGNTAPLQRNKRAIGVFSHRRDAEAALAELRDAGFPMNQVSLIAKDTNGNNNIAGVNRNLGEGNKADEGAKAGAVTGGALGGLGGLLVGLGALAIPGVGPVIAGGAAATALTTALAGGAIGAAAGGLTGGLVGLGIPENRARVYSDRINKGDHLVIVDGTEDEIRRAEPILKRRGIEEFDIFDAADTNGVHHQSYDRDIRHETPVVHTASTNYSTGYDEDDPAVIIIDRRDETV